MWRVICSVSLRTPEGGEAGKGDKHPPLHIPSCRWVPQRGGMWGRENDYEIVNQRPSFLKILIHTDNFLTFVHFRKL